jgi:hypothetical protein
MSQNQTLDRMIRRDGGLLLNPYFQKNSSFAGSGFDNDGTTDVVVPTGPANLMRKAPGWYAFGAYPHTRWLGPTGTSLANNPFKAPAPAVDVFNHNNGITVEMAGPAEGGDIPGGLVQCIPNGGLLAGRRVRVTGSFFVEADGGSGNTVGISLWMKTKVRSATISNDNLGASDGSVTATLNTLTSAGSDFLAAGVAAGDMLFLSGQFAVDDKGGTYEVATVHPCGQRRFPRHGLELALRHRPRGLRGVPHRRTARSSSEPNDPDGRPCVYCDRRG